MGVVNWWRNHVYREAGRECVCVCGNMEIDVQESEPCSYTSTHTRAHIHTLYRKACRDRPGHSCVNKHTQIHSTNSPVLPIIQKFKWCMPCSQHNVINYSRIHSSLFSKSPLILTVFFVVSPQLHRCRKRVCALDVSGCRCVRTASGMKKCLCHKLELNT